MNTKLSAAGFAIQATQGAAESQPAWFGPVGGGGLVGFEVEQNEDELTSATVGGVGEYRESVAVGADYESRMWPASIGALLYAVLGDVDTTGAGAPYSHVITPASELPWCTVFGVKDTERKAASDCKLDELKLEWEGNGPVKVTATWAGMDAAWSAIAYVPDLDETLVAYFKGIHLAATLDLNGSNADAGAVVLGGSVDIKRNLTGDTKSGQLTPSGIDEGAFECDVELKCRVADLTAVRLILTGTAAGNEPAVDPVYGDVSLVFTKGADVVTLASTRVAWRVPDEPDADPKGGPGELTIQGRCYGNPALTATVVNAVASY